MIAIFLHLSAKCNFQRRYYRNKIFPRNHFNRQSSSAASATTIIHREEQWLQQQLTTHKEPLFAFYAVSGVQQSADLTTQISSAQPPVAI